MTARRGATFPVIVAVRVAPALPGATTAVSAVTAPVAA